MSLKAIENIANGSSYYSLRDKAYAYVLGKVTEAYDMADAVRAGVDTKEKFLAYRESIKQKMKEVIGDIPYDKNHPLNVKVVGELEDDELYIRKVIFESRERVYITANLYIPKIRQEKCAGVLLQCGHSDNGKAYKPYHRAAGIIARAGIVVLVPDPPGQGERNVCVDTAGNVLAKGGTANHQQFGTQCFLTGEIPIKYFLADAMRAVDYLCSLDFVDENRIGATGISGGGTMTSLLMVMDERIKAAAPGCWPCSGREYFVMGSAPDCEQIWPDMLKHYIDHFELMACMCPRPLLFLAAENDFIPIEGNLRLYEETKCFYDLMGVKEKVDICKVNTPHEYAEDMAYSAVAFFAKFLSESDTRAERKKVALLADEDLRCTKSGYVKLDFSESLSIYEENLKVYRNMLTKKVTDAERKAYWKRQVYNNREEKVFSHFKPRSASYTDGLWIQPYVWLTQANMPCNGILLREAQYRDQDIPVTICLWSGGTDNLCNHADKIRSICKQGRAVFVVDLTAMGKCKPYKLRGDVDEMDFLSSVTDKIVKALFLLGDSLCALRAFDLMQTIKMIRHEFHTDDITVYTKGIYGVYGRIAAILDDSIKTILEDEVTVADIITNQYYNTYDISHILIPGIAKYL